MDCQPLTREVIVELHIAANGVVEIADNARKKVRVVGIKQLQRRYGRRIIIQVLRSRPDRSWIIARKKRAQRLSDVTKNKRRTLEALTQLWHIHLEKTGLPVIRQISIILWRWQTRSCVKSIDFDLDRKNLLHLLSMIFEREQSNPTGNTKL